MNFYSYMMNLRETEDEAIRELAYELELDRNFPRSSTNYVQLRAYVQRTRGKEMVKAFEAAWKKFERINRRWK